MPFFRRDRRPSVERDVLAARSAAADAFALAHEHALGGDELDREVVLESLAAGMSCLSALLWALHVEFDELSKADRELAIGELVRGTPSQARRRAVSPREDFVYLIERAIDRVEYVRGEATRTTNQRWRTSTELDACTWHLATVLHIVDKDAFARLLMERPVVRAQLSMAEHLMDLAVAEQRIAARERRGG